MQLSQAIKSIKMLWIQKIKILDKDLIDKMIYYLFNYPKACINIK